MVLDRYIGRNLFANCLTSLFVLIAIFTFFAFVDQLGDTGVGEYGVYEAFKYVMLTMPRLGIELLPIAAVIAGMTTLGMLANSSELVVMRTSGMSRLHLSWALIKAGIIIIALGMLVSEFVAPKSEKAAQELRSVAKTSEISMQTRHGLWSRDGNSFINIKTVLPDDRLQDITIYEFDNNRELRATIKAKQATYNGGRWILSDIQKTDVSTTGIESSSYEKAEWNVLLNPEVIEQVTVRPQHLSLYGLVSYMRYLRTNNQSTALYEQAFWSKLISPFSILAMILLALTVVRSEGRSVSIGQRVFFGALLGILFHLLNQVTSHMGIVYGLNAMLSVSLPTFFVLAYVIYAIRKQP